MTRQPPAFATWTLNNLAAIEDSIAGDLLEEYRCGRSSLWYWRQVGVAIVVSAVREIRAHPIALSAGLALGLVSSWVFWEFIAFTAIEAFARSFNAWYFGRGYGFPYLGPFFAVVQWIPPASEAIGSYIAVRTYRGHRPVMVTLYAGAVLMRWVARIAVWSVYYDASTSSPGYRFEFRPFELLGIMTFCGGSLVAALIGGVWAARRASPLQTSNVLRES